MRKKIISFVVLIIGFLAIYLFAATDTNMLSVATDSLDGFNGGIWGVIFMEAFCTIHMSVFVLYPLARIINKNRVVQIFILLFCIRIVILTIGNIFIPVLMGMIDFMAVFFGGFILVPVAGGIKALKFRGNKTYSEYIEVDDYKLSQIGFTDSKLLCRVLCEQYREIKAAYSEFNYKRLIELCTKDRYSMLKNEMKLLEQVGEKKFYKDMTILEAKIYDCSVKDNNVDVSIVLKVEYYNYAVDKYNKVVSGSDNMKNSQMIEVNFHKMLPNEIVLECPNCGSSVLNGSIEACSYCGTTLNFKVGQWLLNSEKIVRK